jgi:hypothetical protein
LQKAFLNQIRCAKYENPSRRTSLRLQQSHVPLFGDLPKPHGGFYPQFQVWSPFLAVLNMVHHLCGFGHTRIQKPKKLTVENEGDESRRTASNLDLISVRVFPSK